MQIDRSKWFYGSKFSATLPYNSALFSSEANKFCCLGALGCHVGYSLDKMNGQTIPYISQTKWPAKLFEASNSMSYNTGKLCWRWLDVFVKINDHLTIDNDIRESWIKMGFKELFDIDVEFVGDYPP